VDKAGLRNKIAGAWIGRIAGCLLGKPVEGYRTPVLYEILKDTDNYPMHKYICRKDFSDSLLKFLEEKNVYVDRCWADTLQGISPVDDDTNYTTFGLKLIETYGKDFTPFQVMEGWTRWIPVAAVCTAERVAYMNAVNRLDPPETATFENPYREYIGAQIRADFFGYVNPGDPETAADMGFRDASISHIKNGIYGEMWVAAMLAAAAVCDDMETIIRVGLEQIPANSRIAEDINLVLQWYRDGVSAMDAIQKIQERYDEFLPFDWCYTNSNAMIVTLGLLYGEKDFGKSICLAVQCGFDTDCNGATVGSIVGMVIGETAIPQYWIDPFQRKLMTSIDGYPVVDVDIMTDKTLELIEK
jgi:ADP-ribosylglycohydrolase